MYLAGEEDDLSELFPLMAPARPLPASADRTERVLGRYGERRALVRSHGITLGRARLAFRSDDCTRCGLCMTGCPHQLIFRAPTRSTAFAPRSGSGIGPTCSPSISTRSTVSHTCWSGVPGPGGSSEEGRTGSSWRVAGSARRGLVLGSLGAFDQPVYLQESVQFVMPTMSMHAVPDPRSARNFTLNQFNLLYDVSGEGVDLCQVHFYEYNPAFSVGTRSDPASGCRTPLTALLRRVSVGLGYVPGWGSPRVRIVARRVPEGTIGYLFWRWEAKRGADGLPCCMLWCARCSTLRRPWTSGRQSP